MSEAEQMQAILRRLGVDEHIVEACQPMTPVGPALVAAFEKVCERLEAVESKG